MTVVSVSDFQPSNIIQQKVTTHSVAKMGMRMRDSMPSCHEPQSRNNWSKDLKLRNRAILVPEDEAKPLRASRKVIAGSIAKTGVQMRDSRSSANEPKSKKNLYNDPKLRNGRILVPEDEAKLLKTSRKFTAGSIAETGVKMRDSRPSFNEPQSRENQNKDPMLSIQQRLVLENEAKPFRPSRVAATDSKSSNVIQQKVVSGSVAEAEVQIRDRIDSTSRPSGNEPQSRETCDRDLKLTEQRLLLDSEVAEPLKTSQVAPTHPKPSNILEHSRVEAQPILDPIWRGSFSIGNKELKTINRILVAAHLSSLACPKVRKAARLLPKSVFLELSNRSHFWPGRFQPWGPTYHSIGLFFFPDNRDDETYDMLVKDMISGDFAMRALLKNAELFVFTSYILPFYYKRFQSKYYLWGVFRARQASDLTTGAPEGEKGNLKVSTRHRQSPTTPLSQSGSYGSYSCTH
ncbi:hypothetical protein TorRG33x02_044190 [Trema orientale]|uniref:AIPP2-like SPOC-like domain-containing protein n=1 Tax=Trema orientale TaxID=63057 RepID=A0A2P5FPD4_TREOI|nr:hypothetical protein TorRG33x02_044190 [Trema orientale]